MNKRIPGFGNGGEGSGDGTINLFERRDSKLSPALRDLSAEVGVINSDLCDRFEVLNSLEELGDLEEEIVDDVIHLDKFRKNKAVIDEFDGKVITNKGKALEAKMLVSHLRNQLVELDKTILKRTLEQSGLFSEEEITKENSFCGRRIPLENILRNNGLQTTIDQIQDEMLPFVGKMVDDIVALRLLIQTRDKGSDNTNVKKMLLELRSTIQEFINYLKYYLENFERALT